VRILLLSNLYPPYVEGGAEILAGDIASSLERLGHEVFVLTSSYGLVQPHRDGNIYRTLQLIPPAHFDRRRPLWQQVDQPLNFYRRYNYPSNARELRRVVAEVQPDILYIWEISGIGVNSLLKALPDLHTVHIPIVFHLGSYWLLYARSPETEQSRLRTRRLKQLLIGNVPALTWTSLIAVSTTVKGEYAKAGFDPARIEVIYNGIDPRFLAPPRPTRSSGDDVVRLLFVGRLRIEKGIMTILKALDLLLHQQQQNEVKPPSIHLNIFGNGDEVYVNELKTFLRDKHLMEKVTFHGRVPQDELIDWYDRSHVMLVPSLWKEPFGLVIAEAMARGLPVIASNVGGPAEILTHDVNGILTEPGDENALMLALKQLIANPEKRAQFGRVAQQAVRERFTIEENVKKVEQHLLSAINVTDTVGSISSS
jgi:glycosyltransferase involved in cell wall biosynthesis